MKYLVLRRFRTYGVTYFKGDVVDASKIRSPRLRMSEGKIIPAVSSSEVPKEGEQAVLPPLGVSDELSNKLEKEPVKQPKKQLVKEPVKEPVKVEKKELKAPKLKLNVTK